MADGINDIRHEHHVTLAHKYRNIDYGAAWRRCAVAVEGFCVLLVEIYDHRVLGLRVEVLRGEEHTLERGAVVCVPVHELHVAPEIIRLLRVDGCELALGRPVRVVDVQVHRVLEITLGVDDGIRVERLHRCGVALLFQEKLRFACRTRADACKAVAGILLIERHELNASLDRESVDVAVEVRVVVSFELGDAVVDFVPAACSLAEIDRRLLAVRAELPYVVSVVEQQVFVLAHPIRETALGKFYRVVVELVIELAAGLGSKVESASVACGDAIEISVIRVEPDQPFSVWRCRSISSEAFCEQGPGAVIEVYAVDVPPGFVSEKVSQVVSLCVIGDCKVPVSSVHEAHGLVLASGKHYDFPRVVEVDYSAAGCCDLPGLVHRREYLGVPVPYVEGRGFEVHYRGVLGREVPVEAEHYAFGTVGKIRP